MARPARRAVGTAGRGQRGALPAAGGRAAPIDRRAPRPPSDGLPVHERARGTRQGHGAPRRVGRDLLGPEERLADGARGRRRTGPRGPSSERGRGPGRSRSGTSRRGWAALFRPKPPAAGSPRGSSTTARGPSAGYAAPQLHTHVVFFNLTHTASGEVRPLQPRELYRTQQYGTAVYRSELALRLTGLGYEIERGESGQPEIRGYTPAYLEASSPRRQQIQAHLEQHQRHGAGAAQIAAHQTREAKLDRTHDEVQRAHREMAAAFGDQPAHVVREAQERVQLREDPSPRITRTHGRDVREGAESGAGGRRRRTRRAARCADPIDG